MRLMKVFAVVTAVGVCMFMVWTPVGAQNQPMNQPMKMAAAGMGEHLVTVAGCNDCHSPKTFSAQGPQVDPARRLSGHPADEKIPNIPQGVIGPQAWGAMTTNMFTGWAGAWGVSYAKNLTPDKQTGIGGWTLDTFKRVIKTGKDVSGQRDILPPMPWFNFATMSDAEFQAVWNYLQSLTPVNNPVPSPIPPTQMYQTSGEEK